MKEVLELLKSELECYSPVMDDYEGGYSDGLIMAITQLEIALIKPTITISLR